jgi:hypothetical protein
MEPDNNKQYDLDSINDLANNNKEKFKELFIKDDNFRESVVQFHNNGELKLNLRLKNMESYTYNNCWKILRKDNILYHYQYSSRSIDDEGVITVQHRKMNEENKSCVVIFGGLGNYENSKDIAKSATDITDGDCFYVRKSRWNFFFNDKNSSQTVANRLNTINMGQYNTIKVVSNSWGNTDALQFVRKMLTEGKKVRWEIVEVANEWFYYPCSTTFLSELKTFTELDLGYNETKITDNQQALNFPPLTFKIHEKERQ